MFILACCCSQEEPADQELERAGVKIPFSPFVSKARPKKVTAVFPAELACLLFVLLAITFRASAVLLQT